MAIPYATVNDIEALYRPLSTAETARATVLLDTVSEILRAKAVAVHKNLDGMIATNPPLASVAKAVTCSVVMRILRQNMTDEPMTQESQSGLGYSWSGTYAIAGGGIDNAILPKELKDLGIRQQRYGVIDFYDPNGGGTC